MDLDLFLKGKYCGRTCSPYRKFMKRMSKNNEMMNPLTVRFTRVALFFSQCSLGVCIVKATLAGSGLPSHILCKSQKVVLQSMGSHILNKGGGV